MRGFFIYAKFEYSFFKSKFKVLYLGKLLLLIMKKKILLFGILSSVLFVSCKKEEVKPVEETQQPVQPFSGEAWLRQKVGSQNKQPVQQQAVQQSTTTQMQTTAGLNPPHGQPGHRCEIPVGAPLDSKPAQKTQSQTPQVVSSKSAEQPNVKINSNNTSNTINAATTPPGMNPPHGQEGHRCDIAVGAPLPKE